MMKIKYTHSFLLLTTMTSFTFRGPFVILQISLLFSAGPWVRIFSRGMFPYLLNTKPLGPLLRHLTDIITSSVHVGTRPSWIHYEIHFHSITDTKKTNYLMNFESILLIRFCF